MVILQSAERILKNGKAKCVETITALNKQQFKTFED